MASSYSELKFELISTGEQSGTWGNTTNTNIGTAINEAIAGMATVAASGAVTLPWANTAASQDARNYVLNLTGTVSGEWYLTVPSIEKPYVVFNNSGGSAVIQTSGGTEFVTIPDGYKAPVYVDGTDVLPMFDWLPTLALGAPLSIANGGTGNTSIPAGVVTSNGTQFSYTAQPSGSLVGTTATQTLTNKVIQPRIFSTTAFGSTYAVSIDEYDMAVATAQTGSVTFSAPSGTPYNGQKLVIRMTADVGGSVALTFNTSTNGFRAVGTVLPSLLNAAYTLYVGCIWNSTASKWDVVAVNTGA